MQILNEDIDINKWYIYYTWELVYYVNCKLYGDLTDDAESLYKAHRRTTYTYYISQCFAIRIVNVKWTN